MSSWIHSGAVLSYILGAVSGYFLLRYRLYLTERGSQLNDHLKDLERLVDAALSVMGSDGDVSKEKLIKLSLHHSIAVRVYPRILEVCNDRAEEYQTLMLRLFELVTADEDDPMIKVTDQMQTRAQEIVATGSDLTGLLREVRRDSLSFSNLGIDLFKYLKGRVHWLKDTFLVP